MTGLDDARFWLDLGQWMFMIGVSIYVWITNRQRATTAQIEAVKEAVNDRLNRHADRLTKVESNLDHVPTPKAIETLATQLGQLHGDFQYIKGWLEGVKGSISQLENNVKQLVENELRGDKS